MISVVTSFSVAGYNDCGRDCLESIRKFWPSGTRIMVYHEGTEHPGYESYNLLETEPCASFLQRHRTNLVVHGKRRVPGQKWSPNSARSGDNFRYDAYKFCRKIFALADAADRVDQGRLFWIDADTEMTAPVGEALLRSLLPDSAGICRLYRGSYHSECGFVGYNLDAEGTRDFICEFRDVYAHDRFTKYAEWHDSFIFDRLIEKTGIHAVNIPSRNLRVPVESSVLGQFMVHYKGNRKLSPTHKREHRSSVYERG